MRLNGGYTFATDQSGGLYLLSSTSPLSLSFFLWRLKKYYRFLYTITYRATLVLPTFFTGSTKYALQNWPEIDQITLKINYTFKFWRPLLRRSLLSSRTILSRFSMTKRAVLWSYTATSFVARNLRYPAMVIPIFLARTAISVLISSGRRTLI